jgi:hypothetical protein
MPYPQELSACPNCGETVQVEEDTMTGQLGNETSRSWGLQLLVEVLEKALGLGRIPDAVRALQRCEAQVEERLVAGERLDSIQLDALTRSACSVAAATRDASHVTWVLRAYPRANVVPATAIIESVGALALSMRVEMRPAIDALVQWLRLASDVPQLSRLEQVVAAMDGAEGPDLDETARNPVLS